MSYIDIIFVLIKPRPLPVTPKLRCLYITIIIPILQGTIDSKRMVEDKIQDVDTQVRYLDVQLHGTHVFMMVADFVYNQCKFDQSQNMLSAMAAQTNVVHKGFCNQCKKYPVFYRTILKFTDNQHTQIENLQPRRFQSSPT